MEKFFYLTGADTEFMKFTADIMHGDLFTKRDHVSPKIVHMSRDNTSMSIELQLSFVDDSDLYITLYADNKKSRPELKKQRLIELGIIAQSE